MASGVPPASPKRRGVSPATKSEEWFERYLTGILTTLCGSAHDVAAPAARPKWGRAVGCLPPLRALARAAVLVLVAVSAARVAGTILPAQLALGVALAATLALPGAALLLVTGLAARLGAAGTLAALAPAGLTMWAPPLLIGMLVGAPLVWVEVAVFAASAALLARAWPNRIQRPGWEEGVVLAGGVATALLAMRWQAPLVDDALFHAGRVRKLLDLPHLSFSGVSAFKNGHPHAGYVFPLLHGVEAAALGLASLEPSSGYPDLTPACAFFVPLAVFGAGRALGGRAVGAAAALLVVWLALERRTLAMILLPPTFTSTVLFAGAILAIVELARHPRDRMRQCAVVAVIAVVAVVHVTYVVVPLAELAAVTVATGQGRRTLVIAAVVSAAIAGVVYLAAIYGAPPGSFVRAGRPAAFVHLHGHPIMLRGPLIADKRVDLIVALVALVPLLVLTRRRDGIAGAIMAGGLALVAFPAVIAPIAHFFGEAQARRLHNFIPWDYVVAVVAAHTAARLRGVAVFAAAGGIAITSFGAAGFDPLWHQVASVLPASVAVLAVAVVVGSLLRRRRLQPGRVIEAPAAATLLLAAALLAGTEQSIARGIASTVVHGTGMPHNLLPRASRGLVAYLRAHDDRFPVVLADLNLAYQLVGQADVYAAALDATRTRAEPKNDPAARRRAVARFFAPTTPATERTAILGRLDVDYVITDTPRQIAIASSLPALTRVYSDPRRRPGNPRYAAFRVSPARGP